MNTRLVAIFFSLTLSGFVPVEPDDPWRSFTDVNVPPYVGNQAIDIAFSYRSNVVEPTTLEIYFSNASNPSELVYARYLDSAISFSSYFTLFPFQLEADQGMLTFEAHGSSFNINQTLTIYHCQTLVVEEYADGTLKDATIANIALIDHTGTSRYVAESLTFSGFDKFVAAPQYKYFDLASFRFGTENPGDQPITFSGFKLLMGDQASSFPLLHHSLDGEDAIINLDVVMTNSSFGFNLSDDIYINPTNFIVSLYRNKGYVPSAHLYFPKDRFNILQTLPFKIYGTVVMYNTFLIDYMGIYYSSEALIGPCSHSAYCLITDNTYKDIGLWHEVSSIRG